MTLWVSVSLTRVGVSHIEFNLEHPLAPPFRAQGAKLPRQPVLFVLIDGLRADAVEHMPALSQLASRGSRVTLVDDPPTISAPQYVAFLTGVPPFSSGQRTNAVPREVELDSVPAVVKRGGGRTAAFSDGVDWWGRLFAGSLDVAHGPRFDLHEVERALPSSQFTVVHLCAVDEAGHAHGATSAEYRAAYLGADAALAKLLTAWQGRGPVVVTSDHGHRDRGGHGGEEPEVRRTFAVFEGPGVVAGEHAVTGRTVDMAPTLSALLGEPAPGASEGRALLPVLDLSAEQKRTIAADDDARTRAVENALAENISRVTRRLWLGRIHRALGTLLVFAGLAQAVRSRRTALQGLGAGLLSIAVAAGFFAAKWGALSLSAWRMYGYMLLDGAIVSAVCTLVLLLLPALWMARRRSREIAFDFTVGAFVGASAVAAETFIEHGVFAERLSVSPPWSVALPPIAHAAFAASGLVLLLTAGGLLRQPKKDTR